MKKILAAALICAVSSFATWDYFPVKPAGKGELKVGYGYIINYVGVDKLNVSGLTADARFSVIEGLEIATFWQFPMTMSYDGDACEEEGGIKCPPTMAQPVIGARYWLPMGLGIALDVTLPFQGDAMTQEDGEPSLIFTPALQFSTKFTEELSLGSEVAFSIPLENKDKFAAGSELKIGAEVDYSLGMITPYLGADFLIGIGKPSYDGDEIPGSEAAPLGIDLNVGATFEINEMFGASLDLSFGLGERYTEDDGKMPITIGATVSVNF